MDDRTRDTLQGVSERLALIARQLGELTLAHERLTQRRAVPGGEADFRPDDGTPGGSGEDPDAALARRDRLAYLETVRGVLYRLLFVVDFTLAHERIDRALLADARTTLVDGVDAVDACLMLDGVGMAAGIVED
jgi:hypothetical protein